MEKDKTISRMSETPVATLMLQMGTPMILSMMLQALYNIVDSAFVSNMKTGGEEALNALTLAFPVQMLVIAIGIGTGVGMNAMLSKCLGRGDTELAARVAGNAEFLAGVIFVATFLFGLFGVEGYISSQTDNPVIRDMAIDYLRICCIVSIGIPFFDVFEKMLQSTGLSLYSTIAQIAGAVTNIILDPILIYGLIGFPELGVNGAAWATVIGQIVSAVVAILFHMKHNKAVKNGIKYLKPQGTIIKGIYSIGFPAIIAQALMSVMTYGLNVILVQVDEALVTAYGLYYKIQQFILFAAFGLRDAITPIISFSHGMRSRERVKSGVKYGLLYTLVIMAVGLIAMEIFAKPLAGLFGLSGRTEDFCISAIRIISLCFVFAGINVALQGVFQALDSGMESLVISILRQFLLVLPVAWIFSKLIDSSMSNAWIVWLTFPIAEGISAVVSLIFLRRVRKNKIDVL